MANAFHYEGFSSPNGTIVPDDVFDLLAPQLTEAELRVLLYIIRRTFGFKKDSDTISLKQMVEGIRTKDGRILDLGAGVAKSAAARAVHGLEEKGIIIVTRNRSAEKGDEPTTYQLRFRADPVFSSRTRGGPRKGHGRVLLQNTQQTGLQETVEQQTDSKYLPHSSEDISSSNRMLTHELPERREEETEAPAVEQSVPTGFTTAGALLKQRLQPPQPVEQSNPLPPSARERGRTSPAIPETPEQQAIRAYMELLRSRFTDHAKLSSSATRAYHLYEQARMSHPALDISAFIGYLEQAASITAERGGQLRYWFSVLEDLLWPAEKQPLRDTSGYARPRRRTTVGGPLQRVMPAKDGEITPGARNRVKIAEKWPPERRAD